MLSSTEEQCLPSSGGNGEKVTKAEAPGSLSLLLSLSLCSHQSSCGRPPSRGVPSSSEGVASLQASSNTLAIRILFRSWGRRWTGQRRPRRLEAEARAEEEVPGTPPPIVPARPAARSGPLRPARVLPGARPRCRPLPCSGRLSPAANATYPGKARAGPGSEPTDKK